MISLEIFKFILFLSKVYNHHSWLLFKKYLLKEMTICNFDHSFENCIFFISTGPISPLFPISTLFKTLRLECLARLFLEVTLRLLR